jgi:hypothetical protein
MTNYKTKLVAASLMLAATSLTSIALTSYAAAQCADCSTYQDRDPFTEGLRIPGAKPAGAVAPAVNNAAVPSHPANNARAEMRGSRGRHAGSSDSQAR